MFNQKVFSIFAIVALLGSGFAEAGDPRRGGRRGLPHAWAVKLHGMAARGDSAASAPASATSADNAVPSAAPSVSSVTSPTEAADAESREQLQAIVKALAAAKEREGDLSAELEALRAEAGDLRESRRRAIDAGDGSTSPSIYIKQLTEQRDAERENGTRLQKDNEDLNKRFEAVQKRAQEAASLREELNVIEARHASLVKAISDGFVASGLPEVSE